MKTVIIMIKRLAYRPWEYERTTCTQKMKILSQYFEKDIKVKLMIEIMKKA